MHNLAQKAKVRLMSCERQENQICIESIQAVPEIGTDVRALDFLQPQTPDRQDINTHMDLET